MEAMLMMLPPLPALRIAWICARWHRNTLLRLTSMTFFQPSTG